MGKWRGALLVFAVLVGCGTDVPVPAAPGQAPSVNPTTVTSPGIDTEGPPRTSDDSTDDSTDDEMTDDEMTGDEMTGGGEPDGVDPVCAIGRLEQGQCWKSSDCLNGYECSPGELVDGSEPGACVESRPAGFLMLREVSPARFVDASNAFDPETAELELSEGVFDVQLLTAVDGESTSDTLGALHGIPLPAGGLSFGFTKDLDVTIFVTDPLDPSFDVECNLRFLSSGEVEGGVSRGDSLVACSNDDWHPPQLASDPGLLIAYELLGPMPAREPLPPTDEVCVSAELSSDAHTASGLAECPFFNFEVVLAAEVVREVAGGFELALQAQVTSVLNAMNLVPGLTHPILHGEAKVEFGPIGCGRRAFAELDSSCETELVEDPDDSSLSLPMTVTTGVTTVVWPSVDGVVELEVAAFDYRLSTYVDILRGDADIPMSTRGGYGGCSWVEMPRLIVPVE